MKTFVVLGMHRSATSLVAKGLSNEISMGTTMLETQPDNPEGFYENKYFVALNDFLLEKAGGSWDRPPSREDILALNEDVRWLIAATVRAEQREPMWGWKDPRTALTIDLFMPHLINPHFICVYRDQKEVAKSLERRGNMSYADGLSLCRVYNQRIAEFLSTSS